MHTKFDGPRSCVEHAQTRIDELKSGISPYIEVRPYALVCEDKPGGMEQELKVKLTKPLPARIGFIAFDAINSLRAALDQAAFACAVAGGKRGKQAKFPFGDTEAEAFSRRTRGSRDIPPRLFDVMLACKPYKGGNDSLWALNKICNSHKHEIVLPTGAWASSSSLHAFYFEHCIHLGFPPEWDSAKNQMVLATIPKGSRFNVKLDVSFQVVFGDVPVFHRYEAVGVLTHLRSEVESILEAIEAAGRSDGIFL